MKARGFSLRAIAEALGRSPSTIAREVGRNSSPSYMLYMSHRAHDRA
ncbi:MAG: helix-turn-helix domain-containing protein, partial [Nitrospirae bacterium]|nr:helix-turn-helix domain-containing protein [Nitrospirota bacterium]